MNPVSSHGGGGRLSWTMLAALVGWLLVGALAILNRVELTRLSETAPAETQDARLRVLAAQVAELAQEVEHYRKRPESVSLERHEAERQAVEQRLAAIEQAVSERPDDDGLQPLRKRLARLEEERARHAMNPPVPPENPPPMQPPAPSHPPPKPRIAESSFRVIGIERRAEERFLVILPGRAEALAQARLLRVGDQADGWRLDAIEDEAGVFSQGGRKRRLSLTGGKP